MFNGNVDTNVYMQNLFFYKFICLTLVSIFITNNNNINNNKDIDV